MGTGLPRPASQLRATPRGGFSTEFPEPRSVAAGDPSRCAHPMSISAGPRGKRAENQVDLSAVVEWADDNDWATEQCECGGIDDGKPGPSAGAAIQDAGVSRLPLQLGHAECEDIGFTTRRARRAPKRSPSTPVASTWGSHWPGRSVAAHSAATRERACSSPGP